VNITHAQAGNDLFFCARQATHEAVLTRLQEVPENEPSRSRNVKLFTVAINCQVRMMAL
jgi:hypothetical protein